MTIFYGEVLLAPRPTPNLEENPSSTVRDCLFNTFAATIHTGGRSSTRNLRTRLALAACEWDRSTLTFLQGIWKRYHL